MSADSRAGFDTSDIRNARLLFDAESAEGALDRESIEVASRIRALHSRPVPIMPLRVAQQALFKLGRLSYERSVMQPMVAARRRMLGGAAAAPPRFLVRVDEFPHARAWDEPERCGTPAYMRFHEILREQDMPYLVAVLPHVSREPLRPDRHESRPLSAEEREALLRLRQDGVRFGLHGLNHRTRFASPRRHSELCGLSPRETEELLDVACAALAEAGLEANVFVAPYNRFDAAQMPVLTRRFDVVGGGPESISMLGFHATPQWRGDAVYLPAYPPFYATAAEIIPAARAAIQSRVGIWIPIVIHWEWEARDEWASLRRLVSLIAPYTANWDDFLVAIGRSRAGAPA